MQTVDIYIDTDIKGPRRCDGSYIYIVAVQTSAGTADIGNQKKVEDTTENQLTLLALETALKRLNKPCHLVLHLECHYVASALKNKWYVNWHNHDWLTAKNEPVRDAEKWRRIEYLLNEHDFEVKLKEPHTYRDWMQRELKKGE